MESSYRYAGHGRSRFKNAVIYLCSHNTEGTMGLIINKLAANFNISDLLKQISIKPTKILKPFRFFWGASRTL